MTLWWLDLPRPVRLNGTLNEDSRGGGGNPQTPGLVTSDVVLNNRKDHTIHYFFFL